MNWFRSRLVAIFYFLVVAPVAVLVLSALPQHAAPQPPANKIVLEIDPSQSKVHWTLESTVHTVRGSFAFKKGNLQLDTSTRKASGEIIVDATSGSSGNDGRDRKMHKEVLESAKYTEVIFRPDHVEGKIAPQGIFTVQVHGLLALHGSEHELTVPVQAEFEEDHWTGSAKFTVPFINWGLKNPGNFFLKVNHSVGIELELKGSLQNPGACHPAHLLIFHLCRTTGRSGDRPQCWIKKSLFAAEYARHEDSQRLGDEKNRQEIKADLEPAVGSHC